MIGFPYYKEKEEEKSATESEIQSIPREYDGHIYNFHIYEPFYEMSNSYHI